VCLKIEYTITPPNNHFNNKGNDFINIWWNGVFPLLKKTPGQHCSGAEFTALRLKRQLCSSSMPWSDTVAFHLKISNDINELDKDGMGHLASIKFIRIP
jgi:hypothetical protein